MEPKTRRTEDILQDLIDAEEQGVDVGEILAELGDKIETLCYVAQKAKSDSKFFAEQAEKMTQRRRAAEATEKRIKDRLLLIYQTTGVREDGAGRFSVTSSQRVEMLSADPATWDDRFKSVERVMKFDKAAAKEALKNGETVKGAVLITSNNITIR